MEGDCAGDEDGGEGGKWREEQVERGREGERAREERSGYELVEPGRVVVVAVDCGGCVGVHTHRSGRMEAAGGSDGRWLVVGQPDGRKEPPEKQNEAQRGRTGRTGAGGLGGLTPPSTSKTPASVA